MESFFSRYRNLIVLLALLAAQLLGLAMQVRRVDSGRNAVAYGDSKGVRLIRLWANAVVTPPEEAVHWVKMSLFYTWQNYIDLHNVRQQTTICSRPSTVCALNRPNCSKMPVRESVCRPSLAFSSSTSIPPWPLRPLAQAAPISPASSTSTRAKMLTSSLTWR